MNGQFDAKAGLVSRGNSGIGRAYPIEDGILI